MRLSRHRILAEKAINAALAAIEIYNKPIFEYREENFCILMFNAWELLLKARILKENNNKIQSIQEYRKQKSCKRYIRNKYGTIRTISCERSINIVANYNSDNLNKICQKNLELLKEIRDASIHFHNLDNNLRSRVYEISAASLKNFSISAKQWFNIDVINKYNFYIMPLAFQLPDKLETIGNQNKYIKKVLDIINNEADEYQNNSETNYSINLKFKIGFIKNSNADITARKCKDGETPITIKQSDEDMLRKYSWSYNDLLKYLRKRYKNFKSNNDFYKLKKGIENNEEFCWTRLFDPSKPRSSSRKFYSPNIVNEFDKHYSRQKIGNNQGN